MTPITEPQAKLLLRKLHWAIGSLTEGEREDLRQIALTRRISSFDARTVIEDLFLVTNPREPEDVRKAAVKQLKELIQRHV